MQKSLEREWDLTIGPDTVRLLIEKARAVAADIPQDYEDGHEHEVEFDGDASAGHHHEGLREEEADDMTAEELRELIGDLNVDEATELVALMFLGRGDYDASEWQDALAEARNRVGKRTADYLMKIPLLADWLEEGLEAIGA